MHFCLNIAWLWLGSKLVPLQVDLSGIVIEKGGEGVELRHDQFDMKKATILRLLTPWVRL